MKNIVFAVCFLFLGCQSIVFADEIVDSKGNIIPCKIETVSDGLVEYYKEGLLYRFVRQESSPVFNDYVDVRTNLLKRDAVQRYSGKVLIKDVWSTTIRNEQGDIDVPFYRVKSVGVYRPEERL